MGTVVHLPKPTTMRERLGNPKLRLIVCGFAYDTETAKAVAQSWADETIAWQLGDCHGYDIGEILYQNKWDNFFLYKYNDAGEPWGIERIEPITKLEAILWMEKWCSPKDIEEVFGKLKEAGEP